MAPFAEEHYVQGCPDPVSHPTRRPPAAWGGPPGISRQTFEEETFGQARTFGYTVLGLGRSSAAELLDREEPLAWAFAALTRAAKHRRPELKLACLTRVATAGEALSDFETFLLVNCIESYLKLTPEETARFDALRSPAKEDAAVKAIKMTWADRMKAEGEDLGMRKMLLQQLEQRFGKLPAAAGKKLSELGSSALSQLANQVLVAGSLAEMGLE